MATRRVATWLAVLAGLLGAGLTVVALVHRPAPPPAPRVVPEAAAAARPAREPRSQGADDRTTRGTRGSGVEDLVTGPVLPAAEPLRVSVPRLNISSRLVRLGMDRRGAMEVPTDPARAGWYHPGPTPGSLGPAVIAGHVTWDRAPAVFFRLAELRRGDLVDVARADDRVAVFRVTAVSRFAKDRFPTRTVFGGADHAGLRLITCGGEYDASARRYRDNVVAFATLVSTR